MDAAADYAPVDNPVTPDTGLKPLALDFSATGCVVFDLVNLRCDGTAPLTVVFTPIASEELTQFRWTFGDESLPSSERSATHTYALPGSYTVTLTAGGGAGVGSVQQIHSAYVRVTPGPVGALCDVDMQCADGLMCWCGSSNPCSPVLSKGLCSRSCEPGAGGPESCPDDTTCADLSAATTPSGAESTTPTSSGSWRRPLCLPVCVDDGDCEVGSRCRDLPATAPGQGWVRVCFASYPLEVGARCVDAAGQPVHADCASKLCSDLGAFGRCSADCATASCPTGTTCARFGNGANLCLANCSISGAACDDDPLLGCEPDGAPGPWGFTVRESATPPPTPTAPPATYCAPKRCVSTDTCGPHGVCPTGGGNCQRQPS
jgi:PKD repeat protein